MGVGDASVNNIMSGIENTGGVKQHNHKKKLRQRFDIIKKLGQGTFGKVQLGINKETGQEVAIKTIKKSKIESDADLVRIRREIQIMSSVQHPNIIHIYEVFENREKMVLVMEYAAGGELYDYLSERKVLQEEEARRIFRQIATACYYCHKHKICHRDLKLENILLDENNNAKIADFGLSNVFDNQRLLNTFCGSPLYASPEIVKGTPYHGPEVDCWSLGVLLYTLVYGAMPFDGSNFKRLVKQISQGDYYEPSKPSPASPLIREMLTVSPRSRANIEKICCHWWVNETYDENCLEISEELANQTPVRLDVLLSLAPPPPQLECDKLVVTADASDKSGKADATAPVRSQSVGSLMEFTNPEKRIIDLINEEKLAPKRKLESTVSSDRANLDKGIKRKDKIIKENTVADITVHGSIREEEDARVAEEARIAEDARMAEVAPIIRSLTQTISKEPLLRSSTQTISKEPSKEMEVETSEEPVDPSLQGAACAEIMQESEQKEAVKQPKLKRNLTSSMSTKVLEGINEIPSQENVAANIDKENKTATNEAEATTKPEEKAAPKKKIVRKKVLTDKNDNSISKPASTESKQPVKEKEPAKETQKEEKSEDAAQTPQKPIERRRSRIFEAAEKFQNMMAPTEPKAPLAEKPKKIIIPGVSVDGFKKEFERKASLTSTSPPKVKSALSRKSVSIDKQKSEEESSQKSPEPEDTSVAQEETANKPEIHKTDDDRKERVKNAVSIISSVLDKEGTRKSKSRPCMMRKPPVPFGVSGRSASGNIGMITSPLSPPIQTLGPKPFVKPNLDKPEVKQVREEPVVPVEDKTSTAEISLKSATLPRRKTTKAQIQLNYPMPKPAQMEFKTEMAHNVQAGTKAEMQRSEVVVPVSGKSAIAFRGTTTDPECKGSKERIIPIAFEKTENGRESVQSPPIKSPVARAFQQQKSTNSQKSESLSRQSTQDSDSETVSTGEPIKKSPREYIIPIAVEGGGYVTPRAGSLEPSDTASTASTMTNRSKSKFGSRSRRMGSLFSDRDSEDESSPFCTLNRHSSFGKDSDTEDSKRDMFHMHRLRSTRPKKSTIEHADSVSSGEEDDDEGFEILTAENLFSTLLSRVRDLTQRLNVDDGARPGFPSSRLLSQFDRGTNFWNRMDSPLSRHSSLGRTFSRPASNASSNSFGVPWRRSVSRDLASDIESVFNEPNTQTVRVPRGDSISKNENLNLADLDLKKLKLSDEDALALSYLTPGLSRRIQKQLLAQLTPSEVRKLHRTLSSRTAEEDKKEPKPVRRSFDRMSSTLPRRYSVEKDTNKTTADEVDELKGPVKNARSFLPVKSSGIREDYRPSYEFNVRSSSIGAEPRGDCKFSYRKPSRVNKPVSLREPLSYTISKSELHSPDSSISESVSRNDDTSYRDSISSRYSDSSASRPYSKYSSDSSYSKYAPSSCAQSPLDHKSDNKKPSTRRISRFLRPDFFDAPKEEPKKENLFLKEKKEREMETQKVLKEIRDKRKGRHNLRSERSSSREKELTEEKTTDQSNKYKESDKNIDKRVSGLDENRETVHDYVNVPAQLNVQPKETLLVQNNVIDKSSKALHDYVNVKVAESSVPVVKKERVSKLVRPKSYPTESVDNKLKVSPEKNQKDSKISKLKRGFTKQPKDKTKEDKNEANKNINEEEKGHKNKILQSIEKKIEKFRNGNAASNKDPEKIKALQEKKSTVETAIKRLREQSLPPANLEPCTESGLIKRAVSVEDLAGSKPLQASRKSVTKILGLFKKYEEQDKKKLVKKNKSKENSKNSVTKISNKDDSDKTNESVINNGKTEIVNYDSNVVTSDSSQSETIQKKERPRSLLLDKDKHFQNAYNGAKSDSLLVDKNEKESKIRSKLPVNSFRRSLNLDNLPEPPRLYKNSSIPSASDNSEQRPNRKDLKLDFSRVPLRNTEPSLVVTGPSTSYQLNGFEDNSYSRENRNSLATTDDSSTLMSPGDDYLSCDSWSACSDFHHINDLHSPTSHNGHSMYSGDESESVIDRIRRKSFYTRFNEKKRPRKPSIAHNYKDLDYCKPASDYSSLDRYRSPSVTRRSSYSSFKPEPTREYKPYTRSASVLNDYVNVPNQYQTYNSKIGRPSVRCLYSDTEDNTVDDLLSTAKSRKHSPKMQCSSLSRGSSVSPVNEQYFVDRPSSSILSPTTSEPN